MKNNPAGSPDSEGTVEIRDGQRTIKSWLSNALGLDESVAQNVVEAHIKERCQTKTEAEKKFKSDIWRMVVYTIFIVLFSISASTSGQEILNVRNLVQPQITNPFSSVAAISDVYSYLETTIIPAVSSGGVLTLSGNVMMTPVFYIVHAESISFLAKQIDDSRIIQLLHRSVFNYANLIH